MASANVRSKLSMIHCFMYLPLFMGFPCLVLVLVCIIPTLTVFWCLVSSKKIWEAN